MNRLLFYATFYALFYAFFASCTSAPKHLAKALKKDKPYVAAETRKLFPCIVTKSDTTYLTDTTIEVIEAQCPDNNYITPAGDTVYLPGEKIQVPCKTANNTQRIETYIEDSAQTTIMLNNMEVMQNLHKDELAKKEKQIAKLQADNEKKEQKIIRKNKTIKWCFILLGFCGLVIFGPIVWKLAKKTINPLK